MKNKRKSSSFLYSAFFFVIMLVFAFYEGAEIEVVTYSQLKLDTGSVGYILRVILLLLVGVFSIFNAKPHFVFFRSFSILMLSVLFFSLINHSGGIISLITESANSLLPLFMMAFFYNVATKISDKLFYICLLLFTVVILYYAYITYQVQVIYSFLGDESRSNSLYIFLFLLPLFLLSKKQAIRVGGLLFVAVCMILSLKRGGQIAFILALLTYFLVNNYSVDKKRKRGSLFIVVLVLGVIFIVLYSGVLGSFSDDLFSSLETAGERLGSMQEDEGSGRIDVYKTTWGMIRNSDFESLLTGHGFNRVVDDSPLDLSAHNDILEVIYDFGIIAVVIYVLFLLKLIVSLKVLVKRRSSVAAAFSFSVVVFLILSMVAHIIIYPYYLIIISAVWGYIWGKNNVEIQNV